MKTRFLAAFGFVLGIVIPSVVRAAPEAAPLPQLQEVYNLLRTNLHGADTAQLDRAAVEGLVSQFHSKALIVPEHATNGSTASESPLGKAMMFNDAYAYLRVHRVGGLLAKDIAAAYHELAQTNKSPIKGVVLDLRFANGGDYACAGATADCFMNSDRLLLDWGSGVAHATIKADAISVPLAVLVNSETSEAAEALAAALREGGAGLLVGGKTAGQASVFKDFPLSGGEKLRIAVGDVKLGDGTSFSGAVEPDIAVNVSSTEEQSYLQDPYKQWLTPAKAGSPSRSSSSSAFRHFNEVELIREHRQGTDLERQLGEVPPAWTASAPVVRDPALARGLDVLKGLSVVQAGHPG